MSPFLPLILAASTLAAITVFWLSRPWWQAWLLERRPAAQRRPTSADFQAPPSGDTLNAALYRDQFAELERDRAQNLLAESDYEAAREDLNRRLLEDVAITPGAAVPPKASASPAAAPRRRRAPTWFAMILLVPLATASLYLQLGTPAAVFDATTQARRSMGEMEDAISSLAKKLDANPNNPEGWAMLARSYGMMGRWAESIAAFERIGPTLESNPNLLATFAEVRFRAAGDKFTPDVRELVAKALVIDPNHLHALLLAGSDAFKSGHWQAAINYWEKLVTQLEPGSDDVREISESIAQARAELGGKGGKKVSAGGTASQKKTTEKASEKKAAAGQEAVRGRIELDPKMRSLTKPDTTVFVIARAVGADAPRMPLAGTRIRVADLPYTFTLDDSMAMNPAVTISSFAQVRIEARVSASGNAASSSGDLIGQSEPVRPGTNGVMVRISQQVH